MMGIDLKIQLMLMHEVTYLSCRLKRSLKRVILAVTFFFLTLQETRLPGPDKASTTHACFTMFTRLFKGLQRQSSFPKTREMLILSCIDVYISTSFHFFIFFSPLLTIQSMLKQMFKPFKRILDV